MKEVFLFFWEKFRSMNKAAEQLKQQHKHNIPRAFSESHCSLKRSRERKGLFMASQPDSGLYYKRSVPV